MVGSAILYHFPDKQELYGAVVADLSADLLGAIEDAIAEPGAAARAARRAGAGCSAQDRCAARRLRRLRCVRRVSDQPDLGDRAEPIVDRIVALFEEGARSGEIRPVHADPYLFFTSIAGAILYTVTVLPAILEERPGAPAADDAVHHLEHEAVAIAATAARAERTPPCSKPLAHAGAPTPVRTTKEPS